MRRSTSPQRVQVLVQLHLVARTDDPSQILQLRTHRVQNAAVAPQARPARFRVGAAAGAEQPLEHRARIVLDRQRGGRSPPRDGVRVGAARTAVAVAHHRVRLDAELQRGDLGLLRELPRRHLVHRHRRVDVGAVGDLERHPRQESTGGPRVVAAALHQVRRLVVEPAAQQHTVLHAVERLQRRRQVVHRPRGPSGTSRASTSRWGRRRHPAAGLGPPRCG